VTRLLVACLGNALRGDDVAGLLVARALRASMPAGVDVEEHSDDVVTLAESMARHADVIVIDAVVADVPPGTVLELDPPEDAGARTRSSSHGLGVPEALAIARVLGSEPHVRLIGIAGSEFSLGSKPTAAVVSAASEVARSLAAQLQEPAPCA
jgi:hydrogenase maturation protease